MHDLLLLEGVLILFAKMALQAGDGSFAPRDLGKGIPLLRPKSLQILFVMSQRLPVALQLDIQLLVHNKGPNRF